jgi:uncharacterized protein involved in exopolysaccharide biosynthesis
MTTTQVAQNSHVTTPGTPGAGPPGGASGAESDRWVAVWRSKWWILLAAVAVAAAVAAVSLLLPATYEAAATVRVVAQSQAGLPPSEAATASNDLAGQYAQLATSSPIVDDAARSLRIPQSKLGPGVSAGTVAAQNLIRIGVQAPTGRAARERANAVATAFVRRVRLLNSAQARDYAALVRNRLGPLDAEIATARSAVDRATLLAQRGQLSGQLALSAAGAQPLVEVVAPAQSGARVRPKPALYSAVAFILGALVAAQIFGVVRARRMAAGGAIA